MLTYFDKKQLFSSPMNISAKNQVLYIVASNKYFTKYFLQHPVLNILAALHQWSIEPVVKKIAMARFEKEKRKTFSLSVPLRKYLLIRVKQS